MKPSHKINEERMTNRKRHTSCVAFSEQGDYRRLLAAFLAVFLVAFLAVFFFATFLVAFLAAFFAVFFFATFLVAFLATLRAFFFFAGMICEEKFVFIKIFDRDIFLKKFFRKKYLLVYNYHAQKVF